MATTLWIRRQTPIPRAAWEACIDAIAGLGRQSGFSLGAAEIPGAYAGPLRMGRVLPVFAWRDGQISFNFKALSDDVIFTAVVEQCATLGAFIEDEAGGRFTLTADGLVER